ncbi:hypothetical protein QN277_023231 [Acacia crassicarpa]|uniref:DUF4283 domain-containing protein n=1 Tax=Acacia crassicarpa TaxID=499986 RepID=A0AAE1JKP3_9FABA|nr:hypothetical protein QN277_023231 [Acacia crassicarpa]
MKEKEADNGISYRNKLLNLDHGDSGSQGVDDVTVIKVDFLITKEDDIPSIEFSKEVRDALAKGMERTLVVKLLGRSVTYGDLLYRTQAIWQGSYQLVDAGRGFFFASFVLDEDHSKVLTGGPWMIIKAYLTVQLWTIDFDPSSMNISKVVT